MKPAPGPPSSTTGTGSSRLNLLRYWRTAAIVVLVVGSAVALGGAWAWHVSLSSDQQERFDAAALSTKATVQNSIKRYDELVDVLQSELGQNPQPTHARFSHFVSGLDLPRTYPGVFGAGYVALVQGPDLGSFVSSISKDVPGYTPDLAGAPPPYCLGSYATWSGPSQTLPLLGINLCSYPVLASALDSARDTGSETIVSGAALAPQWRSDFAFFAPVYSGDPTTVSERRAQVEGWVAGLVNGPEMAKGGLGGTSASSHLGVQLYSGVRPSRADLVLSSPSTNSIPTRGVTARAYRISAGSPWTLRVYAIGGYWAGDSVFIPVVVMTMGLVGNLLLALFIASLGYARVRALREVETATASLREREEQFSSLSACSPSGILQMNSEGEVTYANSRACEIAGRDSEELMGSGWHEVIDPRDRDWFFEFVANVLQVRDPVDTEVRVLRPNGEVRQVRILSAPIAARNASATQWVVNAHDITEEVAGREALAFQALHDPLTSLPNRALFLDRLAQDLVRRDGDTRVAVLMLDLDQFQVVNDSLGHDTGDDLLKEVARRLSGVVRADETVARLGGDEFALVLHNLTDVSAAVKVAKRIMLTLSATFAVGPDRHECVMSASVGIVMPDHGESAESVLRDADTALNRAKAAGRGRFEIFEQEQHLKSLERLKLEGELRRALDGNELSVYFQPVIDLQTGNLSGAEVLVRWDHPTRGLVPPMDFIPVAEATGLIIPLGMQVTRAALLQLAEWDADADGPKVPLLSVNFSALQMADAGLGTMVRRALDDSGVDPGRLCAEITETLFMTNDETTVASIAALKEMGVCIGIDDFGTGYSSLAYLHTLPANFLKIDRQFIAELGNGSSTETIVGAVVDIAHALGLRVVAEGVEERFQLEFLKSRGSDAGQGFFWSRPLPADEFARWCRLRHSIRDRSVTQDSIGAGGTSFANGNGHPETSRSVEQAVGSLCSE